MTSYTHAHARPRGTPLHAAAKTGATDVARVLIAHGADIHRRNTHNQTALEIAIANGHDDLAAILKEATIQQEGHAAQVSQGRGTGKRKIG
jgi:ankyrin repeat protein